MGFISWIKNIFGKRIIIESISKSKLITLSNNNAKVKFGTKLEVPQNFACVLSYKNRMCDTFTDGTYKLDVPKMPVLSRLQRLTKPNKSGDLPKNFIADIYYVNLMRFEDERFSWTQNIKIKDKKYRKTFAKLRGKFSFEIFDPVSFLEALATQYGVIKNDIAKAEISFWVGDLVAKKVEKNSPGVQELFAKDADCFDGVLEYVNKHLSDCGVSIKAIDIEEVKFPKRIYKKTKLPYAEESSSIKANEGVEQQNQNLSVSNDKIESSEKQQFDDSIDMLSASESQNDTFADNLNQSVVSDVSPYNLNQSAINDTVVDNLNQNAENDADADNSNQSTENDANDDKIDEVAFAENDGRVHTDYKVSIEYIECECCGALNPKNVKICFNCKNRLD